MAKRKAQRITESDDESDSYDNASASETVSLYKEVSEKDKDDRCSKRACAEPIFHAGRDPGNDYYDSIAKRTHRVEFAINCEYVSRSEAPNRDVLYLETASGKTTQELINHGFLQKELHPCNRSHTEMSKLLIRYPNVIVEHGDILDVFNRQYWLGAWFDLETSLLLLDHPKQPWDLQRVPDFARAMVVAMSLSSRRVCIGTEAFAVELQNLMQDNHGFITSPQMARAYSGRSGKQNMIFALSHYHPLKWSPKDYLFQHVHIPMDFYGEFENRDNYMQVDGHLVAVVSRVSALGRLHLQFQSRVGWFFTSEDPEPPLLPEVVQTWMDQWKARACAASKVR